MALVLTRETFPVLDPARYLNLTAGVMRGTYILADAARGATPDIILVATGSEVQLA